MLPSQTKQYFDSFINYEHKRGSIPRTAFKLDRVRQLLRNLGDPQKDLKVIHVAGSKGKGSVCAMTASILQYAGYTTGLYTSPHINTYRERIRILRADQTNPIPTYAVSRSEDIFPGMISEEELCDMIGEIRPAIEQVRRNLKCETVTFFEMYTALALCYFRKKKADFVVLETGLGGRLDATNVVESLIGIITPISLEHADILGNTVAEIAKEKAAIIKNENQKVVLAPQEKDADKILMERCRQYKIEPVRVDRDHRISNVLIDMDIQIFDLATSKTKYEQLCLKLMGEHQRHNACAVVGAIECLQDLGFRIPEDAIRAGLENTLWPCRFEAIKGEPLVILDGAHNGDSARALSCTVRSVYGGRKIIIIFGVSEDKNEQVILRELEGLAGEIIYAKADHPRSKNLAGAVTVKQAIITARQKAGHGDIILVTGSIFIVSEARKIIMDDQKFQITSTK